MTKDALIDAVWNGRIVSEATISGRINAARTAVGDNGKDQHIIRTVQRRGFELVPEVDTATEPTIAPSKDDLTQTIRYTAASDGTNIAWSSAGDGPPLVFCFHHVSHLELDWTTSFLKTGFA